MKVREMKQLSLVLPLFFQRFRGFYAASPVSVQASLRVARGDVGGKSNGKTEGAYPLTA